LNTTLDLSDLNRKVGQLFMTGLPGPDLDDKTIELIRDHHLGGIILFSRNIQDPLQVATLCRDIQDTAAAINGHPLFVAVDQEGGRVARLKRPFTEFQGHTEIGLDERPFEKAEAFGKTVAREMTLVGMNMNLAPVVDVRHGEPEKHLVGRTFGEDPDMVAQLGRTVVRSLQQNGIMAVAKHFPGLGRTTMDPHFHLPKIEVNMEEMEQINLPPFKAAMEEMVAGVMTSHAIYPALDPEQPATLSPAILHDLLREKLGYSGLLITDDLEMGAIANGWGVPRGAAASFRAGADVLLICENQDHILESMDLIKTELLRETLPPQRLTASYKRLTTTKSRYLTRQRAASESEIASYFGLEKNSKE
jgi:beta-N-acetylhexosaminidase